MIVQIFDVIKTEKAWAFHMCKIPPCRKPPWRFQQIGAHASVTTDFSDDRRCDETCGRLSGRRLMLACRAR